MAAIRNWSGIRPMFFLGMLLLAVSPARAQQAQLVDLNLDVSADRRFDARFGAGVNPLSLRAGRDLDGDGVDDLVVEAVDPAAGSSTGRLLVIRGNPGFVTPSAAFAVLAGTDPASGSPALTFAIGRVDGDAVADVLGGNASFSLFGSGAAFIVPAGNLFSHTLPDPGDILLLNPSAGAFGQAVVAGGDLNGDGAEDTVAAGGSGGALLFLGPTALDRSTPDATITVSPSLGSPVAFIKDMNGDGRDELLLTGPGFSTVYLLYGRSTAELSGAIDLTTAPSVTAIAIDAPIPPAGSFAGPFVASGDVNGDGLGDLILASPSPTTGVDVGKVHVFFGSTAAPTATASTAAASFAVTGIPRNEAATHISVASGADFNGDGIDDILIGSARAQLNEQGAAFLVYGDPALAGSRSLSQAELRLRVPGRPGNRLGESVALARLSDRPSADAIVLDAAGGEVYVLFGSEAVVPTASAGPDIVAECEAGGATVTLDGSGTSGDADVVRYEWFKGGLPPLGSSLGLGKLLTARFAHSPTAPTTTVELRVTDRQGRTSADTTDVTVRDTRAPILTRLVDPYPVAAPGPAGVSSSDPEVLAITRTAVAAVDACDGAVAVSFKAPLPAVLPVGTSRVTLAARDGGGNTAEISIDVRVLFHPEPLPGVLPQVAVDLSEATGPGGEHGILLVTGQLQLEEQPVTGSPVSVRSGRDLDGGGASGAEDLVIEMRSADPASQPDQALVVTGSATGDFGASALIGGMQVGRPGAALSFGDVDGDGGADIVAGNRDSPYMSSSGLAFVVPAGSLESHRIHTAPDALDPILSDQTGAAKGFGAAVAADGDLDGNGVDDVVVGAEGAGGSRVHVYLGPLAASRSTPTAVILSSDADVRVGGLVHIAPDMNGDGRDELVLGGFNGSDALVKLYVFFGRSAWSGPLDATATADVEIDVRPPFQPPGVQMFAGTGTPRGGPVLASGDLNGDGLSDLILGNKGDSPGVDVGKVHVFFGSPALPRRTSTDLANVTVTGIPCLDTDGTGNFAIAVASGGDFNGDGMDDLLIGAPTAQRIPTEDGGLADRGAAFILFGHPALRGEVPVDRVQVRFHLSDGPALAAGVAAPTATHDQVGASVAFGRLRGKAAAEAIILDGASRDIHVIFGSTPLFADAGPDRAVECVDGGVVALDGSRSLGDIASYEWFDGGPPPAGRSIGKGKLLAARLAYSIAAPTATYALVVTARDGRTSTATARVTFQDTRPPVFSPVYDPFQLLASSPAGIASSDPQVLAITRTAVRAVDGFEGPVDVEFASTLPALLPLSSETRVDLVARDSAGRTAAVSIVVRVIFRPDPPFADPQFALDLLDALDDGYPFDPLTTVANEVGAKLWAPPELGVAISVRSGRDLTGPDAAGKRIDDLVVETFGDVHPGSGIGTGMLFVLPGSPNFLFDPPTATLNSSAATSKAVAIVEGLTSDTPGAAWSFGDVDGDGVADLVFGDRDRPSGGTTGVAVIVPSASLSARDDFERPPPDPDLDVILADQTPGTSSFGYSVASGGDLDGDGIEDVAVGSLAPAGSGNPGVFIYLGPLIVSHATPSAVIRLAEGDVDLTIGRHLFMARDMDGDGRDELVIGAGAGKDISKLYIIRGRDAASLSGAFDLGGTRTADVVIDVEPRLRTADFVELGSSAAGPILASGDLNGDGFGDLILEHPDGATGPNMGKVRVFFGSRSLPARTSTLLADMTVTGIPYASDASRDGISGAIAVASGADFSGDGIDDLLIGSPGTTPADGSAMAGAAFVLLGHPALHGEVPIDFAGIRFFIGPYYSNAPPLPNALGASVAFGRLRGGASADAILLDASAPQSIYVVYGTDPAPPVADAGPDIVAECMGGGADVTLDGARGSRDANGEITRFEWFEGASPFLRRPLGASATLALRLPHDLANPTTTATLVVTDRTGLSGSDTVRITVRDTRPPLISVRQDPYVVRTARLLGIAASDPQVEALTRTAAIAVDACAGPVDLALATALPATIPLGATAVTLVAVDESGNRAAATLGIDVRFEPNAPQAEAGPDQTLECAGGGADVALDGRGSTDADGDIAAYEWRVGGVAIAAGPTPTARLSFDPARPTVAVTLVVADANGLVDSDTLEVTLRDTAPPLLLTVAGPFTVTTATRTGIPLADSRVQAIPALAATAFDACDGRVPVAFAATVPATLPVGLTSVTLVARDASGNAAETAIDVEVLFQPRAPVADAGADVTIEGTGGGAVVTLSGAGSSDPDGDIASFEWRRGSAVIGTGTVVTALFLRAPANPTTVVTLRVTDREGQTSVDAVEVTVTDTRPPVITLAATRPIVAIGAVTSVATTDPAFVALLADAGTAFDLCDGPVPLRFAGSLPALVTPGVTQVTVEASDASGNVARATVDVEVVADAPAAAAGGGGGGGCSFSARGDGPTPAGDALLALAGAALFAAARSRGRRGIRSTA